MTTKTVIRSGTTLADRGFAAVVESNAIESIATNLHLARKS
jgi:hypothetical protein